MTFNLAPIFATLGAVLTIEVAIYLYRRGKGLLR